jgi:hypothetical protein
MFSSKNANYLLAFSVIAIVSYIGMNMKPPFANNDEYDLIRKYLLNESPLYGFNKPKLWIHSKYEVNSREWKSFQSRTSTDLNQPYLHLTIKTIINHCGSDFNICLIDDDTFSKLIPSWDIDLSTVAEPDKSYYREVGMLKLVYYYGGIVVPNSFICTKSLKPLWQDVENEKKPFLCEQLNRTVNNMKDSGAKPLFLPSIYFMGAKKNDETIKELIEYLKRRHFSSLFTSQPNLLWDTSYWCIDAIRQDKINVVGGELIGIKTQTGKPILLEELMEENYLDLVKSPYGIYIPADEILRRPKFQWFSVISAEDVFKTNAIVAKHLKASIVDSNSEYITPQSIKSVVSI